MKRTVCSALVMALALVAGVVLMAQRPASDECVLPKKGTFSVGYVAESEGRHYRCLEIFDSNLKPAGVAWIEVVRDNRFVIKD